MNLPPLDRDTLLAAWAHQPPPEVLTALAVLPPPMWPVLMGERSPGALLGRLPQALAQLAQALAMRCPDVPSLISAFGGEDWLRLPAPLLALRVPLPTTAPAPAQRQREREAAAIARWSRRQAHLRRREIKRLGWRRLLVLALKGDDDVLLLLQARATECWAGPLPAPAAAAVVIEPITTMAQLLVAAEHHPGALLDEALVDRLKSGDEAAFLVRARFVLQPSPPALVLLRHQGDQRWQPAALFAPRDLQPLAEATARTLAAQAQLAQAQAALRAVTPQGVSRQLVEMLDALLGEA